MGKKVRNINFVDSNNSSSNQTSNSENDIDMAPSFIKIIKTSLGSNTVTISAFLTKKSIIYYMVTLDGLINLPSKQNILK